MLKASDIAQCRELMRGGSRTFSAASKVLPRPVADAAISLYAFCRLADDAVDGGGDRAAAVARLTARLDRIYGDIPEAHPADRAFAAATRRHGIPRALPQALLEGLQWDAEGRRYETLADLLGYAARVAGSVGAMMTLAMGRRARPTLARACELGLAMQLTNIARDVGEDARAGRLYLPLAWMREAGLDPDAFMAAPQFSPELGFVVRRLLGEADRLYARAATGIADLPAACRPGIRAAATLYAAIGDEIARHGYDSVSRRAVVSSRRKLSLLAMALLQAPAGLVPDRKVPLYATRFLLDAVGPAPAMARRPFAARLVWTLELFEKLERRDQMLRQRV
jgi:phytoene synthase